MCRWLMLGLLALFLLFLLAVAAVVKWGFAGLLGVLLALSAFGMLARLLFPLLLQRLFMLPFRAKGGVLRDARVAVHSVTPAESRNTVAETIIDAGTGEVLPAQLEPADPSGLDPSLAWYWVEATITPRGAAGPFTLWEPGELNLAPESARAGMLGNLETVGFVQDYRLWRHGGWEADTAGKHGGEQRLRLLVGVPPALQRARFRYYLELFGRVEFPAVVDVSR